MNEKVSSRQIIFLIIINRITTILTVMSTIYMSPANQDIWIIIILSFFYTMLSSIPLLYLANKFNDFTIIGYLEKIFGKVLGKGIGALYGVFFGTIAILFSYITIQMIQSSFLTDTKPGMIISVLIVICVYISSKGMGTMLSSGELFIPIILTSLIVFAFLGYKNIDLSLLLPVYKDSNFLDINIGAIQLSLIFIDIYPLTVIVPKLEDKKHINKIFVKSVFYSLLFVLMVVIVTQTGLGIEQAKHSNFPFLTYVRRIKAYSVFERIESVYTIMWISAMIIKITTYIYLSYQSFKEIFRKQKKGISLYIIGALVGLTTYYLAEINPMMVEIKPIQLSEYIYYFIFKTLIPLIALVVYLFRRKSFEKQERLGNFR